MNPTATNGAVLREMTREALIKECANGNKDAGVFLSIFIERAHWLDDLVDEPLQPRAEALALKEMAWLVALVQNPFFQEHKAHILPVMLLGLNAWADSDLMPPGVQRDVVKGMYHEVAYLVAMITGGWPRLRSVTRALRRYDIEEPPTPIPGSEQIDLGGFDRNAPSKAEGGGPG